MVRVAQWIARRTSNPEVVGSNPTVDDCFCEFQRPKRKSTLVVTALKLYAKFTFPRQ